MARKAAKAGAVPEEETRLTAELRSAEAAVAELKRQVAALKGLEQTLRAAQYEKQDLQRRLREADRNLAMIHASLSWRLTGPLRRANRLAGRLLLGVVAWLTLRPGSRPERMARRLQDSLRALASPKGGPSATGAIRYIYVDHTVSCPTNTGVQRVTRGLCKILMEQGAGVRFVKWSEAAGACVPIDAEERRRLAQWNGPPVTDAEAGVYPAAGSKPRPVDAAPGAWLIVPEVTHITYHAEPVTARLTAWAAKAGLKTGFIFYDAIPLRRPEFAAMAAGHAQYMRELRRADAVWPISRWSADELASFWGVGRDVDHAYLPQVRPVHLPAEFDRPRAAAGDGTEKLVLCVGTVEPRKNQTGLVRAFQVLMAEQPDSGWRLVLAGNLHPAVKDEIEAATGPGSPIEFRGHVSDAELSELYDRCAFTVFPSIDEGYGLPILESLWQGKPCLCADFGAMGEVASGGGCLTLDVRDPVALKTGLKRLMDDAPFRRSLAEAAAARPVTQWADYLAELKAAVSGQAPLIYYWIDGTIAFPANTGIQRVTRQLARGLIEAGFRLTPVKWGGQGEPLIPATAEDLAYFARWNGPGPDQWSAWVPPADHAGGGWFMMTELPLNLTDAEQKLVRRTAAAAGLRSAAVFYDTIPWKMRDLYPDAFAQAHRAYIGELADYDLVLTISGHSRSEMVQVLGQEFGRAAGGLGHIRACLLPAEFPERRPGGDGERDADGTVDILCVGTVEPRKNHERLLDAFQQACEASSRPLRLTLVGGGLSFDPDLARRVRARVDADPRLTWEESADDERVRALYERCDFTVYPSLEEGFGMPILESLWYGKPAICADFGSMGEVAEGGGCLTADVRDTQALAAAITALADDPDRRAALAGEAGRRRFRTWADYAGDVAGSLGLWAYPEAEVVRRQREALGLSTRPRLSVCISTYNRSAWLTASLANIARLYPEPVEGVEFVICDNASTDDTPAAVQPFLMRPDAVFRRNPANVGMLGNLRETARAAQGDYVWILGDDDLLQPGALERVLGAMDAYPDAALVYLNYAYTSVADARTVRDFDRFFFDATPIVPAGDDRYGPIREICAENENFFTAIYTLVFRRDHALRAYSQDTSGRPFSTMLTCIPTTYHVLNHMMEEPGVWIGNPQVVVNLNVSWTRYAPLWILERIPEVYEVALQRGVRPEAIDRWRRHTLASAVRFFEEIFTKDPLGNAAYFSPARFVARFADLPEFEAYRSDLVEVYGRAHAAGHPAASDPPSTVFATAGGQDGG